MFFPVIYVPGIAGEFFRDQALTVTISLLVSILAALLLQPMLSAHILKVPKDQPSAIFRPFENGFQAVMRHYHRRLEWIMEHKVFFFALVIVGLGGAAWLGMQMRTSFMPDRTRGDFTLAMEMPGDYHS